MTLATNILIQLLSWWDLFLKSLRLCGSIFIFLTLTGSEKLKKKRIKLNEQLQYL